MEVGQGSVLGQLLFLWAAVSSEQRCGAFLLTLLKLYGIIAGYLWPQTRIIIGQKVLSCFKAFIR